MLIVAVYLIFVQLHVLNCHGYGVVMISYIPCYRSGSVIKCFCVCEVLLVAHN